MEQIAGRAVRRRENVLAVVVDDALVNVQRTSRLFRHRLCQKRRVHFMLYRCFAKSALEQENQICELERIDVPKIDLEYRGS